jgi:hypothetical protein
MGEPTMISSASETVSTVDDQRQAEAGHKLRPWMWCSMFPLTGVVS